MITPDLITAAFELLASAFILNHARVLWKTRQAYGVSLVSTAFFSVWGLWNLWYYPHLDQTLAFYAGIMVMVANTFWVYSIWKIRRLEKNVNPHLLPVS